MSRAEKHEGWENGDGRRPNVESREGWRGESGIIVFGGGGRGCSTTGCLFWIVVSVGLTILVNLILLLLSGVGHGIWT